MADGANLQVDGNRLRRDGDRLVRRYLSAATATVAGTTKGLERRLEAGTRAAVPGKLWQAWASRAFPGTGPAQNPVGTVFVKGGERTRGAVTFWTQPGAIRGRGGQFLAVPLPAAGAAGRRGVLTPAAWEARTGVKLRPVFRPGKPPLLVADNATLSARGAARGTRQKRLGPALRGTATVPIFVLLPMVKFRNAFAVAPVVAAAGAGMASEFARRVSTLNA